jgi:hypothetical protein
MATLTEFRTEVDQVRASIAVGNYQAARTQLTLARVTLFAIPDSEMNEERLRWQREVDALSNAIRELEKEQKQALKFAENGPIVFSPIQAVRH